MTLEEWENSRFGDKIKIKESRNKGKIVTIDGRKVVKFIDAKNVKGFLINNMFYPCFYVLKVKETEINE